MARDSAPVRGVTVAIVRLKQDGGSKPVVVVSRSWATSRSQGAGSVRRITVWSCRRHHPPDTIEELAAAFPSVHTQLDQARLFGLATLSALVGMECPGIHSLLSEVSVSWRLPNCQDRCISA